jgi:hypothetical protein
MLNVLQRLADWLAAPANDDSPADILAHPLIERMSERELADLPLRPIAKRRAGRSACPA